MGRARQLRTALYGRPFFYKSLRATLYFAFGSVFLRIVYTFLVAMLLNQDVRGKAFFRTVYYLPSIVPVVASSMIWMWLYHPDFGLFNAILKGMGLPPSRWIHGTQSVIPSIILMDLWAASSTILIFLAGLQGVPRQLLEAVEIDGGNWWNKLTAVTLPHMTPFIFFNMVLGFVSAFQIFTQSFIMTNGGPNDGSLFFVLLIYREAFGNNRMGLACAIAWILFLLIALVTFLVFKTSAPGSSITVTKNDQTQNHPKVSHARRADRRADRFGAAVLAGAQFAHDPGRDLHLPAAALAQNHALVQLLRRGDGGQLPALLQEHHDHHDRSGTLLTSSMVGYGFAACAFRSSASGSRLILSNLMLPYAVSMLPTFLLWAPRRHQPSTR